MACIAARARPVRRPDRPVKLNLGSGPLQVVIRWLPASLLRHALRHTEVGEDAAVQLKRGEFVLWDLRYGIPFADGTAEAVFSSHVLEHLSDAEAIRLLSDVARVLVPGVILRIVVPEIQEDEGDAHEGTGRFLHSHRSRWTWPKLQAALEQAGFEHLERTSFQHGRCPEVALLDNRPESLFVEATTPAHSRVGSAP